MIKKKKVRSTMDNQKDGKCECNEFAPHVFDPFKNPYDLAEPRSKKVNGLPKKR